MHARMRARVAVAVGRAALAALALGVALAGSPDAAQAAPKACSAKDRKAAGSLADKGFEKFEAADYEAAIDLFGQAEARCHSPRLLVFLGRAHARVGKLLRARELLEQAANEPVTRRSPASFREAQVEARKDLEVLKPRIPVLQALFTGVSAEDLKLTLDGAEVSPADLQRGQELDPGEHTLAAEAPGFEPAERHLVLREAVVERLEIALRPIETDSPPPPPPPVPEDSPSIAPPLLAFTVGAIGIGVGVATGLVSANTVSDIKSRCEGNQCLKSDAPAADRAAVYGTVSTVGFIVGGVGVATGIVLLVVRSGGESEPSGGAAAHLGVEVGPGSIRLKGTF
jgi:hypothetical protein